jgi:HlyD family secretion protein
MRSESAVGLLLALLLPSGCHRKAAEDDEKSGPKKVACAPAQEREVSDTIDVRGTLAPLPDRDALVSPQTAGRIVKVLVREGDRVTAGQPIAQIDTTPLQDDLSEARANVARARAERDNAQTTLNRVKRVFDKGIAARQEVEDAAARYASAKAGEDQAAAAARRAQLHIERATVRSPLAGVVLKVMRRSGELADGTPATPIVEIGDPSQIELVADAPGQDLARIPRGASATVEIGGGGTYKGKVAAVSPAVDKATGLGVVRVSLGLGQGPPPPLGIFGVAHIASGAPRKAVVVPAVALRNAAGPEAEVVVCGQDKIAHVVRVKTGVHRDDHVEVLGEVKPGSQVAVAPVLGIADGDKLLPPEEEKEKGAASAEDKK